MNRFQAINKCNKKAWPEIKAIKNAANMLEVEQAINDAVEKTFGFYNKGFLMVRMRKLGQMGELEHTMRIRRINWDNWLSLVRTYLIEMIPERLHKNHMYQKLK